MVQCFVGIIAIKGTMLLALVGLIPLISTSTARVNGSTLGWGWHLHWAYLGIGMPINTWDNMALPLEFGNLEC